MQPLLAAEHSGPLVGEIRGMGAMLALELVSDRTSRAPAPPQAVLDILARALARGLIAMRAGLYANCIRLLVPLVITDDQLDEGLEILSECIRG
jgi:4-aminobutyrate aminotransferase/(S)-3-amino-2-methylpropionate transaminase